MKKILKINKFVILLFVLVELSVFIIGGLILQKQIKENEDKQQLINSYIYQNNYTTSSANTALKCNPIKN